MNVNQPRAKPVRPPISERWPQILRYPLQVEALSAVTVLAAAHGAVHLVLPPLLAGIIDLFIWAALFRYAFEVLRWTANGRETAPEVMLSVGDVVGGYAVLLLVLVEVAIALTAAWYSVGVAIGIGVMATFAMPAMMMILALEEGLARALNPLAWLMLCERIGRPYFFLVGFFCACVIVQSLFSATLAHPLPGTFGKFLPGLGEGIVAFVVNYLLIVNFHLIGSVIHQHADELGYAGHLGLQDEVPWTDPSRKILDSARSRAAEGDTKGAAALLREEIDAHPELLPVHDEYRHWLGIDEDQATLVAHGKSYIPILVAQHQERRAVTVAHECFVMDPTFALAEARDTTRLAHAAAEMGQTQTALNLIAGFHKRFRNHPDIARNYLLAAKLWAERMNKEMQARAMLQQIKLTLPNDPAIPDVDAYLAYLDKIASTKVGPAPNKPAS